MNQELKRLLQDQINEGTLEEQIQDVTLGLIANDNFKNLPTEEQDIIYQLNMNDLNQFDKNDYAEMLKKLEDIEKGKS